MEQNSLFEFEFLADEKDLVAYQQNGFVKGNRIALAIIFMIVYYNIMWRSLWLFFDYESASMFAFNAFFSTLAFFALALSNIPRMLYFIRVLTRKKHKNASPSKICIFEEEATMTYDNETLVWNLSDIKTVVVTKKRSFLIRENLHAFIIRNNTFTKGDLKSFEEFFRKNGKLLEKTEEEKKQQKRTQILAVIVLLTLPAAHFLLVQLL